MILTIEELNWN